MSLLPPEDEGDDGIEVAWEDQQRINTFSKLNNRLSDIQDQLKGKQEEKEYYDDLETELELAYDDAKVLYKMGEAFFHLGLSEAKRQLRRDLKKYDGEIQTLEGKAGECERGMKELKVLL
ncbi:Prefoldin beta-like protein [Dioszegia hungarica]|uniref:Prefoldin subunit 4 n=1 Tax=Dioszegia hungarica TaxID=4972 RepID=A0AA38HGV3_9TREE|nr:Prefoldin beta-like protein [Dioszegia hungarica]KAI9639364.1 Prefoldin beta-like protein [Dioszegia hungarica]